ncbi:unnamed protein product, partial [marine sediment metagenome]
VEFIHRARRFRKMCGGAMRQAGIIAAGAIYALEHHRTRLVQDHINAQELAQALAQMPGIDLDPAFVETNIIIFRVTSMTAAQLAEKLHNAGVYVLATAPDTIRAITHLDITSEQINQAIDIFRKILIE